MRRSLSTIPATLVFGLLANAPCAAPLGSSFAYQGRLFESGQAANGLYDLQACLFDDPSNPVPIACIGLIDDLPVEEGLFTVALDFGTTPFNGEQRYLELRVRPGASTGAFTTLAPRQAIRAAPEALRASTSSAAPWAGLTGIPTPFADGVDDNSGGTVTSIATGTGLTGGPVVGAGTIAIAAAGVGIAQIAANAIDSARIVDASVASVDLGTDSVGTNQIASNAVTLLELANGAVDTAAVIDGSVTAAKIAAGAVGLAQINAAQVQSRIGASCPLASYLRGINADGSVVCADIPGVNTITTVDDPPNQVGNYSSIAIGADGLPVISYLDLTAGTLEAAKCANAACTGTAIITTLDDPANVVGYGTSIAIDPNAIPVISYYDQSAAALKVARCANAACSGVPQVITVDDPPNNVGFPSSLAFGADGLPVIAYRDSTAGALKAVKCVNVVCGGATTITTVDDPTNALATSLAIAVGADGLPVISYNDQDAGTLRVAKCVNAACSGASTVTTVDDPANFVGGANDLAIGLDGRPVISYFDATAGSLKVAQCANAACTGTATITTLDDSGNVVGSETSIAIGSDGLPVIAYRDATANALKVAKCANPSCTGTALLTTLDDPANVVGQRPSIAIGSDGLPVISYYDSTAGTLKVVKCGSRSCR